MNMTKIANKLNVSQATVSRVINNKEKGRVSPEVAQKIRDYAKDNGFIKNTRASSLRLGISNEIGLVLPWVIPEIIDVVNDYCVKHSMTLTVQISSFNSVQADEKAISVMLEHHVGGLIWYAHSDCDESLVNLARERIKHIAIIGEYKTEKDTIQFDYCQGISDIIAYAKEQKYQRIVFLGFDEKFFKENCDCKIFADTLDYTWIALFDTANFEQITEAGTIFVCWNDWYAIKLYRYLKSTTYKIPHDIGIIMVGDLLLGGQMRLGELVEIPFTALCRDFTKMAKLACDVAVCKKSNTNHLVPMQLQIRGSTKKN